MIESDFQTKFNKWLKKSSYFDNCSFELKFINTTRKKSIHHVRDFQAHQLDTLYETQHNGLVYKISDQSFGLKPFDCFKIKGKAYIAIMFWKPRQTPHSFYMVNIDSFLGLIGRSEKPFFNEEQIATVGDKYIL